MCARVTAAHPGVGLSLQKLTADMARRALSRPSRQETHPRATSVEQPVKDAIPEYGGLDRGGLRADAGAPARRLTC